MGDQDHSDEGHDGTRDDQVARSTDGEPNGDVRSLLDELGLPADSVTKDNVHHVLQGMAMVRAANELTGVAHVVASSMMEAVTTQRAEKARLAHGVERGWLWLTALAMVLFCGVSALAIVLAYQGGEMRDATELIALVAVVLGAGGAVVKTATDD